MDTTDTTPDPAPTPRGANGRANCILEVCCGTRAKQIAALMGFCRDHGVFGDDLEIYCALIVDTFDLAEKGTLLAFKHSIRRLAREGYTRTPTGDGG